MRPTIIKPPISAFPFPTGRQHVPRPPCGLAAASKGGDSSSPAAGGPTFGRGTDVLLSLDDSRGRRRGQRAARRPEALHRWAASASFPPLARRLRLPPGFTFAKPESAK